MTQHASRGGKSPCTNIFISICLVCSAVLRRPVSYSVAFASACGSMSVRGTKPYRSLQHTTDGANLFVKNNHIPFICFVCGDAWSASTWQIQAWLNNKSLWNNDMSLTYVTQHASRSGKALALIYSYRFAWSILQSCDAPSAPALPLSASACGAMSVRGTKPYRLIQHMPAATATVPASTNSASAGLSTKKARPD